jgi:hypothetical protein
MWVSGWRKRDKADESPEKAEYLVWVKPIRLVSIFVNPAGGGIIYLITIGTCTLIKNKRKNTPWDNHW